MEADGAGGIDVEFIETPGLGGLLAEDDFRGRGAADVAEADEEDLERLAINAHGRVIGRNPVSGNQKSPGIPWLTATDLKKGLRSGII
jgi:hypothetical protein